LNSDRRGATLRANVERNVPQLSVSLLCRAGQVV